MPLLDQLNSMCHLPLSHQVAIFYFRTLKPDMWAGFDHGSLNHTHKAPVHLPHLISDRVIISSEAILTQTSPLWGGSQSHKIYTPTSLC